MKIYQGELTQTQIDAGIAAMKGRFTGSKIMSALGAAGVTNVVSGAEALINRELMSGSIRRVTKGIYERTISN